MQRAVRIAVPLLPMMRSVIALTAIAASAACVNSTGPEAALRATVVERTVQQVAGQLQFRIVFEVANPTDGPVFLVHCAVSLERRVALSAWNTVWSPVCIDIGNGPEMIPAGASRVVPVLIWPQAGIDDVLPLLDQASYRLSIGVLVENDLARMFLPDGNGYVNHNVVTDEFSLATP